MIQRTSSLATVLLAGLVGLSACNSETGTALESLAWPVAAVSVSPLSSSINIGQSVMLVATVWNAAGTTLATRAIGWTSSDTTVATISGVGLVTAVGRGECTMTVWSEGKNATAQVSVR